MKRLGAVISSVVPNSIADELELQVGDEILEINSSAPSDLIEYSFLVQDEELEILVKKKNGEEELIELEKDYGEDLGLSFESAVFDRVIPCANKCIFCFVDGQPDNLRDSLYVKDDDWRLSYLQGTYVTTTNFRPQDWERLEAFKFSPLFISVHTTNPELRTSMMKNKNAGKILENLDRLSKIGIDFHAQIVLCPGINDKKELARTLSDLKKYKKHLKSLAVVPVGISMHHANQLEKLDKAGAIDIIEQLDKFNSDMKKNIAMASDEIFLLAEREIPPKKYYGKFLQIEDGVGAIRLYLDDFEKRKKTLPKKLKKPFELGIITGSISKFIFDDIVRELKIENLELSVLEIKNRFFGERITVTGLITAGDIIYTLKNMKNSPKNIVLPSVMLKEGTEQFIDGLLVSDIEQECGVKISVVKDFYSFKELADIIKNA